MGKAQDMNSKLLTSVGWKRMGDIQVGDSVIGSNGLPVRVSGVYPQGLKPLYQVTFTDDSSVRCTDEHLWSVHTSYDKWSGRKEPRTMTLRQIMDAGLAQKNGNLKYYIPIVKPVEFSALDLLVDPYILGVLIGDGCLSTDTTVAFCKPSIELADNVREKLPVGSGLSVTSSDEMTWRISGGGKVGSNQVLNALREMGLMGCRAEDKFVPNRYKFTSVANRVALLQGLLDTDGSVSNHGIVLEYGSVSYQLALDVQFLVESLGGTARLTSRDPWFTYKGERRQGQQFYRINISLPGEIVPFRVSSKLLKYRPRTKYQPTRGIKSIEYLGKAECQCIAVDVPDHLYVTDHCVVTHNTTQALVAAKAMQQETGCHIFVVAPVILLEKPWLEEAEFVGVRIEVFSDHYNSIPYPLEDTKYMVIADESHRYQSIASHRTKALMRLTKYQNCLAVWLLSGTPMANGKPVNLFPLLEICEHPLAADKWEYERKYCQGHRVSVGKGRTAWRAEGAAHLDELAQKINDVRLRRTKKDCLDLPPKIRKIQPVELSEKSQRVYDKVLEELRRSYEQRLKNNQISDEGAVLAEITRLRKAGSLAKVEAALDIAEEVLLQDEQIVLFTEFKDTANRLHESLKTKGYLVELLTGDTPKSDRQAMIDRFQCGETKVLVGTSATGGLGITLTSASFLILVDRSWVPGINEQTEDRLHRMGVIKSDS